MLIPWKESYDQPRQHIKKQRHYFINKSPSSQSCVFPVVMYGCDSWTIKKAEHWRVDAFELWCWRRFLRVPWTARWLNEAILKEISPEYSLEELMLNLKLQYFGHLMRRTDSLEEILMLGKIEDMRRRSKWRMRWLDGITDQWTWVWFGDRERSLACCHPWGCKESDMTEWLTELRKANIAPLHRFKLHQTVILKKNNNMLKIRLWAPKALG